MTRIISNTVTTANPQRTAEMSEAERRRNFIERMEQKLRSKELIQAARHGYL
jgi:hypothetical protein